MTRFDLDMDGSMEPSEHGRWVRYEDAQRKPLSEEWIAYCWRKSMIGTRIHYVDYLALVRETERAHNIKGDA